MAAALERVRRRHLPFLCFENLQVIISSLVWWCKQRISIFHSCNWEQEVARERQSKDVIIEEGGGGTGLVEMPNLDHRGMGFVCQMVST